jgi:hypothetical protein
MIEKHRPPEFLYKHQQKSPAKLLMNMQQNKGIEISEF